VATPDLRALAVPAPRVAWRRQIYDISIDKVNKPFLPVASGEMTVKFAWVAVRLARVA
jgi:hypothetical protein